MRPVFIIHGAYGHPGENWFPWLKKELASSGYDVFVPKFPTPKNQTLKNWMNAFDGYAKYLNENSIVVGHSLGVAFLLNILEKHPVKAAFFVASVGGKVDNEFWEGMKTFADRKFDWESIRENCLNFFVYHSDNDPYIPLDHARQLAENLHSGLKIIKNAGHFNEKSGYRKFEILLKDIRKATAKDL